MSAEQVPEYLGEACFSNTNRWRLEEYSHGDAERVYEAVSSKI